MEIEWQKTCNRFVAIFDIMGFKDLVQRQAHDVILKKLEDLKEILNKLQSPGEVSEIFQEYNITEYQTRSITFSDTIIIFSQGESILDFRKIVFDSMALLKTSLQRKIGIKGALSYGTVTVDFEKSLFFGQPIIDAYLLHEELLLYTAIFDNTIEQKFKTFKKIGLPEDMIVEYKTPLKSGRVMHNLIKHPGNLGQEAIEEVKMLYETVSGKPRQYIDNTLDFLKAFH